MFIEKVNEHIASKIKLWPVNSNRASDLGNPCLRYHVYNRTRWAEKALHDVGLQRVFDMGNEIERIVIRELQDAGCQVVEQQRAFSWPEYKITGSIDGKIIHEHQAIPFDVKSCSPWVFKTINTIDDLKKSKHMYHRKYVTQLNLYMLMDGIDKGLFFFKDKTSGGLKEIWMDLDYQLGEETLKRAEAINKHVDAGTLPDKCAPGCGCEMERCPFAHICLPDMEGKEVEIDTGELETMIKTLYQLESAASEYDELNNEINRIVSGREKILAGEYFITGKWITRKTGAKYWKKSIIKV
jgi:hypothetical protein